MLVLFFLTVCLICCHHTSSAVRKIGEACRNDNDCGRYEFCRRFSFMTNGGCSSGRCICRPGFNTGQSGNCEKIFNVPLGSKCTGAPSEVWTHYAACVNGVLQCSTNFIRASDNIHCVPDTANGVRMFGEECPNGICGGVGPAYGFLTCSPTTLRCTCADPTFYYDKATAKCVPRQFGDACESDSQCASKTYAFSGYACVSGKCGCRPDHTAVTITHFNNTHSFSKRICQQKGIKQVLPVRSVCSLRPEETSFSSENKLCLAGLACLRCPSDENDSKLLPMEGRCQLPGKPVEAAAVIPTSNVGATCSDDNTCGTNEHCLKKVPASQGILDPPCRRGICRCINSYAQDKDGICSPYIYLPVGSPCTNAPNELLPNNTFCSSDNFVNCTRGMIHYNGVCYTVVPRPSSFRPSFISVIVRPTTNSPPSSGIYYREYGEDCSPTPTRGSLGCRPGFTCTLQSAGNYMCDCLEINKMFDQRTGVCRQREHGDPCFQSIHCQGAYSTAGAGCINGRCGCGSGYITTQAGVFNATAIIIRNLCVPVGSKVDLGKGDVCRVNKDGNSWCLGSDGLACFQCPEDVEEFGPTYGRCRSGGPTYYLSGLKSKAYGRGCNIEDDCLAFDTNATCSAMAETYLPGCAKSGTCRCAEGTVLDRVDGYCYRLVSLPYNATCSGAVWELFPAAAYCNLNFRRVTCINGYFWSGFACTSSVSVIPTSPFVINPTPDSRTSIRMTLMYSERCGVSRTGEVAGRVIPIAAFCDRTKNLECIEGRCNCTQGYRWLADPINNNFTCVPRIYGDLCDIDLDCYIMGGYTEAHALGGAKCVNGLCLCNPSTHVRTDVLKRDGRSPIDNSSVYTASTICLRRSIYNQYIELAPGQNCTLAPWDATSYGGYVRACAADSICMMCPGDFYPTCQKPLKFASRHWTTDKPLPTNPTAYPPLYENRTIGPTYDNRIVLPWFYSEGTLRPCQSDLDCGFSGQSCVRSPSPTCQVGTCHCPRGLVPYNRACQPMQVKRLREPCSVVIPYERNVNDSTTFYSIESYPLGALCRRGRVECANSASELQNAVGIRMRSKQIALRNDDNSCFNVKSFGQSCQLLSDLCNPLQGLECLPKNKTCGCSAGTFDTMINRCRYRFITEQCSSDDDCYPGNSLSVRCAGGTCRCLNDADAVDVRAYLGPLYQLTITTKLCLPRGRYSLVNAGQACSTAERIGASMQRGSAWSRTVWPRTQDERICAPGLTCMPCDPNDQQTGFCTQFSGNNVQPENPIFPGFQPVTRPAETARVSIFFVPNRHTPPPLRLPPPDASMPLGPPPRQPPGPPPILVPARPPPAFGGPFFGLG